MELEIIAFNVCLLEVLGIGIYRRNKDLQSISNYLLFSKLKEKKIRLCGNSFIIGACIDRLMLVLNSYYITISVSFFVWPPSHTHTPYSHNESHVSIKAYSLQIRQQQL